MTFGTFDVRTLIPAFHKLYPNSQGEPPTGWNEAEAIHAADARNALQNRCGLSDTTYLECGAPLGEIPVSLCRLYACIDALEQRVRELESR